MDSGFKNENNFSICASLEADSLFLGQSNYLELGDTGMHIFQIDKWGFVALGQLLFTLSI